MRAPGARQDLKISPQREQHERPEAPLATRQTALDDASNVDRDVDTAGRVLPSI
jgi:hypothetical protein